VTTWPVPELSRPTGYPPGLVWTVEMTAGSAAPVLCAVSRRTVRHRMAFIERWRQYNAEEAGILAAPPPQLYAQEGG
jgi:hypothetical protein